MLVEEESERA